MSQVVLSPSVARTSVVPSVQRWGQTRTPERRAPTVAESVNDGEQSLAVVLADEVSVAVRHLAGARAAPHADAARERERALPRAPVFRRGGPLASEYRRAAGRSARRRETPRRA